MPPTANEDSSAKDVSPGVRKVDNRPTSWRRGIALCLASAALFALCPPGRALPWVAWVAMAPLFLELRRSTPLRGSVFAGLFGWLMWVTSVWWLHSPLHDIVGMSRPGAILFTMAGCLLMALPYVVSGFIVARWPRQPGVRGAARDAAIFTTAITWMTPVFQGSIAHTQYRYPVVLQVLELGGAPLLLFLMLWVNCLAADAAAAYRNRISPQKSLAAAAGLVGAIVLYGFIRLQQFDAAMQSATSDQWYTVGAIQPNIPIPVPMERQPATNALENDFFTALEQARELAIKQPEIDLLALPENPATFDFNHDAPRREALGRLIKETGKPVLLNADAIDRSTSGVLPMQRYNVALLMDTNRNLAGHYQKVKRVPFVEYIPFETIFPSLRSVFVKGQRVLAGPGAVVFGVRENIRLIPLICYEGTISAFTRRFVAKGGNFIVNQVNDSWFLRTPASEIHLALTLFRSIEYRVPLVRVTNSGIGAHIQANGEIVPKSQTELFTEAATAFPLFIPANRSLYATIGDWWMLGFLLFVFRTTSGLKKSR